MESQSRNLSPIDTAPSPTIDGDTGEPKQSETTGPLLVQGQGSVLYVNMST
jgi:hypothetical protein